MPVLNSFLKPFKSQTFTACWEFFMDEKCPSFLPMLICRCYKLHLGGRGSPHTRLCHFSGQVHFNGPSILMSCQMLKSSVQNPTPAIPKISSEAAISSQGGFVFGKCHFIYVLLNLLSQYYGPTDGQGPARTLFFLFC